MSEDTARPIIIVKKKVNAAGHHGGAWKVAYADFVTAMMAFFMVMWLVASLNKEQRSAMFKYFNNPSMEEGHSVKAAPGQVAKACQPQPIFLASSPRATYKITSTAKRSLAQVLAVWQRWMHNATSKSNLDTANVFSEKFC